MHFLQLVLVFVVGCFNLFIERNTAGILCLVRRFFFGLHVQRGTRPAMCCVCLTGLPQVFISYTHTHAHPRHTVVTDQLGGWGYFLLKIALVSLCCVCLAALLHAWRPMYAPHGLVVLARTRHSVSGWSVGCWGVC